MNSNVVALLAAETGIRGDLTPRVWTPPLRELTPETSYGFDVIDFAREVMDKPLDPWQQWCAIHLGELLPDGRPRFRTVLLLVARQNGKTYLAQVLIAYWLYVEQAGIILGTSTDRGYAKRTWSSVCALVEDNEWLSQETKNIRKTVGEEALITHTPGCEYVFAPNKGNAGRSLTVARWLCDELREHRNYDTMDSATNAMNAVRHAQTVCITNQGGDNSPVLHDLREAALGFLETGEGDPRLGIFEYSAPIGCDPEDPAMLAMANPNLGYRLDPSNLIAAARKAKKLGGDALTGFLTEVLCQRVDKLDPAIEPTEWAACATTTPTKLDQYRDRLALAIDVSLDQQHVAIVAAATIGGTTHTEVIRAWSGREAVAEARKAIPVIVEKVRPHSFGWMPNGPAAVLLADLTDRRGIWPPRGVKVVPVTTDVGAICQGLVTIVGAGELQHPDDPMLNHHVAGASKLWRGDLWVFKRRGSAPVNGLYALAVAVHLARTLKPKNKTIAVC